MDSEYLRILSETLESGVSILDENMNYLYLSDSVYSGIGATRDQLKPGDPLSKCHDIMFANGFFSSEILNQQELSAEEQKQRNANGGDDEGFRLVTMENGTTYRFVRKHLSCGKTVSIADDVSELVEKDILLDKALALGNAGYWSYDVATKTYTLSKSIYAFLGPDIGEKVKKQSFLTMVHPEDRHLVKAAMTSAHKTGNRFEVTARTISVDGAECYMATSGEIIRDADGKITRIQAFVRNVTDARLQAEELENAKDAAIAASQAKSEFLANMSHEIRTPMNGILGMAEMLSGSNINDRQREFVNVINSSASALLNIINDILDFSKIEAGAFEIDPVPFNLKSSINDVTSLLRAAAHEKGLELIINYPANLPKNFIGDGGRLRQVITNLVGNAVKFTESGHVTIDVDIQKSRDIVICTLDVKDTGIGISPDKMSRIFDKFTQADGSTTRVYGGTGLGLTISKHIVEMMGGRMRVESELGEGSSFGFRVPLPIDPDVKEEAFDSSNIANKRVLIIDDIETNQIVFTEQLQSWGMSTDVASDGVEALNKIQSNQNEGSPYDLILLDYLMPGINGQDFAQLISNTASLNSPPIIMVSSCDQPVSTPVLSEIGINSYLLKPVRERRLFDTVVKVLSNLSERKTNTTENAQSGNMVSRQTEKQEILVAEDFNLNQDVVKLMLAETMFQPVFANTGQEVLDIYMQAPDRFPMILMDVSMPVMDGYQATRAIRAYEVENNLKPLPIVALTGHALKDDRRDCLESGMNDYLTKPVKRDQLLDKLELYSGKVTMIENIA